MRLELSYSVEFIFKLKLLVRITTGTAPTLEDRDLVLASWRPVCRLSKVYFLRYVLLALILEILVKKKIDPKETFVALKPWSSSLILLMRTVNLKHLTSAATLSLPPRGSNLTGRLEGPQPESDP